MKTLLSFVILFFACLHTFGETIFICTDEECDGTVVPLDEQVREGVFDGLFEAGHIVFDDCVVKRDKVITSPASIRELLTLASEEEAPFLVIVRVHSTKKNLASGAERIQSEAEYLLYDVAAGARIGRGVLTATNLDKEVDMKRKKLWFSLGEQISVKIGKLFETFPASGKKEAIDVPSQTTIKE